MIFAVKLKTQLCFLCFWKRVGFNFAECVVNMVEFWCMYVSCDCGYMVRQRGLVCKVSILMGGLCTVGIYEWFVIVE